MVWKRKEACVMRILFADDHPSVRRTIGRTLVEAGHYVDLAASGEGLLEKLTPGQYDVVVTDQSLPAMSGLQVLRKIKSDKLYEKLPVIIFTRLKDVEPAVKMEGGIYAPKPYGLMPALSQL